ncbi:MAG TPA: protein DA1 [Ktedonobacteraceae bacterium]|nr:protein DA1 [Ktedonobacteraceae bacterium]
MPLCKYCGQPVYGEYIVALEATWHPEHFVCAGCGQPLGKAGYLLGQGKPYHQACYATYQAPRCAYCHQPVVEAYTQYNGQPYHTACFREHVVARCIYCQKPLIGQYLIDVWGDKFCPEHEEQYPHCSFCSRLIPPDQQTPGWREYDSLRCSVCRYTAVETAEQAQPLFSQLKQWMGQQGFRFNQLPLSLELCGRARLGTLLHARSENHPLGVTLSSTRIQNGSVLDSRVDGVAVLQGMPALLFAGVVLHELGHVWLTVHGIGNLPLWAEEGFCQLLSHRYYTGLATPEARYRAESLEQEADPIYGDGFRRIRALSERTGFAHFVERLRVTKKLPGA